MTIASPLATDSPFTDYLRLGQQRVDAALQQQLTAPGPSLNSAQGEACSEPLLQRLNDAMRYSLLGGGKRLRPILCYAAAGAVDSDIDEASLDGAAAALEMIHSYSLVHDDLPAMDDDDLRRGQPTCHRAFDEATAILAGDALHSRAFELLTELPCDADTRLQLIRSLSGAAGPAGMVGGQAIDLASEDRAIGLSQLETLHRLKTGALIRAAVAMGAIVAGASANQRQQLDRYACAIGLSFQVWDDILDIEGDTETLGKTQGADIAHNKATYPALLGLEASKHRAGELHQEALCALQNFGHGAQPLRELSAYIISRSH